MAATKKKVRRTYAQLFLDKLAELAPDPQKLIGNRRLIKALKWTDNKDRYSRIRSELIEQNKIVIARGSPGGSVGLVSPPGTKGLSVFISYSHADETRKIDLLKHFEPLRRLGLIDHWDDRKIPPGTEWDKAIFAGLEKANIILLLISIDFINSSYCYDVELEQALDLHEAQKATVIPVILRTCMWKQTSFAKLQALPKDARAVSLWPDPDEAFLSVAEGVRQVAEEILGSK